MYQLDRQTDTTYDLEERPLNTYARPLQSANSMPQSDNTPNGQKVMHLSLDETGLEK